MNALSLPSVVDTYIGVKESDVVDAAIILYDDDKIDITPFTEVGEACLYETKVGLGRDEGTMSVSVPDDPPVGIQNIYSLHASPDAARTIISDIVCELNVTYVALHAWAQKPDIYVFVIPEAQSLDALKDDRENHIPTSVNQLKYSVSTRGNTFLNKFKTELGQNPEAIMQIANEWNVGVTKVTIFFAKDGQIMTPDLMTML